MAAFITFEGGEGSGKSTQARRLAERLRALGKDVVLTREPGGSPFAERVRTLLLDPAAAPRSALTEALLFYAARADHLAATIEPALRRGHWIISDRFSDSTRVYQGEAGGLAETALGDIDHLLFHHARPDLTLIIDVPVDVGLGRADKRHAMKDDSRDLYETRDRAFHERVRLGYLKIANAEPDRCVVIDGTASEDEVAAAIWDAVSHRILSKKL